MSAWSSERYDKFYDCSGREIECDTNPIITLFALYVTFLNIETESLTSKYARLRHVYNLTCGYATCGIPAPVFYRRFYYYFQ